MDETVKAVGDSLTDHLTTRNEFGVEPMKDVLEVFPFSWFLRVKQFEEFLNEAVRNEHFQCLDICRLIDNELQEEFIDGLQVWPSRVN